MKIWRIFSSLDLRATGIKLGEVRKVTECTAVCSQVQR